MMPENHSLRPLDPGERFIWLMDHISCANFVVMAELTGWPVHRDILRSGLDKLQMCHPLLSARVVEEPDGTVAFHRLEGAGIPLHIEERGEDDWHVPIEGEFSARFDDAGLPLLRCHLLQLPGRSVLSLTFHHAIADARSGVALLRQLLLYCLRGIEPGPAQDVPPPMHSLFPPEFRWQDHPGKAEELARTVMGEFLRHGAPAELPFLNHREPKRQPRLKVIQWDASQGRRLQERCRAEGASVHGAICAAQLIATRNLFGDGDARTLYMMCPADLRPFLASDVSGHLSYCTTFLRSNYRVDGEAAFWPLAREIGGDLKHRLQRGDGHLAYASLPLDKIGATGPAFEAFAAQVEQLPAGSNISNIGRVPQFDDCLEVDAVSFALCSLPKHLTSLNVSGYKDRLMINLTFDAAKLPPELEDRLAGDIRQLLDRAIASLPAADAVTS